MGSNPIGDASFLLFSKYRFAIPQKAIPDFSKFDLLRQDFFFLLQSFFVKKWDCSPINRVAFALLTLFVASLLVESHWRCQFDFKYQKRVSNHNKKTSNSLGKQVFQLLLFIYLNYRNSAVQEYRNQILDIVRLFDKRSSKAFNIFHIQLEFC